MDAINYQTMPEETARELIAKLSSEEEDGWTYTLDYKTRWDGEVCSVLVRDENGHFLGYL